MSQNHIFVKIYVITYHVCVKYCQFYIGVLYKFTKIKECNRSENFYDLF